MNKLYFKTLTLLFVIVYLLSSCSSTTTPAPSTFPSLGIKSITISSSFNYDYKINSAEITLPGNSFTSNYSFNRNNTESRDTLTQKTGTMIQNVPINILQLICLNNPKSTDVNSNSVEVKGWKVEEIHVLNKFGGTLNVSNAVDSLSAISFSFTISYFPDGVYKIYNHVDQSYNQTGVFQPVIENDILVGITYQYQFKGINNTPAYTLPSYTPNPLSYGIWGVDENYFYPLYSINREYRGILKMKKISF